MNPFWQIFFKGVGSTTQLVIVFGSIWHDPKHFFSHPTTKQFHLFFFHCHFSDDFFNRNPGRQRVYGIPVRMLHLGVWETQPLPETMLGDHSLETNSKNPLKMDGFPLGHGLVFKGQTVSFKENTVNAQCFLGFVVQQYNSPWLVMRFIWSWCVWYLLPFQRTSLGCLSFSGLPKDRFKVHHSEDHPRTCKWLL